MQSQILKHLKVGETTNQPLFPDSYGVCVCVCVCACVCMRVSGLSEVT